MVTRQNFVFAHIGKRKVVNGYYSRPLMGLEIVNNSPETQSLKFLSMYHRHNMSKTCLSVRSILGDTVYEDKELRILMDYIFDNRHMRIFATIFNTSLLYGAFEGKQLCITHHRRMNGEEVSQAWNISDHINKTDSTKAEIEAMFVLDFFTELQQTDIQPGERLLILFDTGNRQSTNDMIDKANKLYGAEKRRKILLTL